MRDADIISRLAEACVANARDFNTQDAANSLWALAALNFRDAAVWRRIADAFPRASPISVEQAGQLLQSALASRAWLHDEPLFDAAFLVRCRDIIASEPPPARPTSGHREVLASLARLNFAATSEALVLDGLHSVDALVRLSDGREVAVEFDGPTHFLHSLTAPERVEGGASSASAARTPETNGSTRLRDRLLVEGGYLVVSIPYWEWDALCGSGAQD